jgi:ATP-binding cassette subfamily B protein
MLLIALVAYFLAIQPDGIERAIPILGALTLGAQKVLPLLQQVYSSWTSIQGSYSSLQDTLEFLEQPLPYLQDERTPFELQFKQDIKLKELSFRYNEQAPWVFENINLTITKSSKIGIIGETGSGKSTLMDIIMGLMHPTSGNIEIDGKSIRLVNNRAWHSCCARAFLKVCSVGAGVPIHDADFLHQVISKKRHG